LSLNFLLVSLQSTLNTVATDHVTPLLKILQQHLVTQSKSQSLSAAYKALCDLSLGLCRNLSNLVSYLLYHCSHSVLLHMRQLERSSPWFLPLLLPSLTQYSLLGEDFLILLLKTVTIPPSPVFVHLLYFSLYRLLLCFSTRL
jgi:hypothetical protein